jgi:hypothetical protein
MTAIMLKNNFLPSQWCMIKTNNCKPRRLDMNYE